MTAPLPYRDVMGMRIPLLLVVRILAAVRDQYPTVVEGLSDDDAMKAVVRHWVTTTLTNYEATQAAKAQRETAEQAMAEVDVKAAAAFQRALEDTEQQIIDAPPG